MGRWSHTPVPPFQKSSSSSDHRPHLQRHLQVVSMCSCSAWCMIARRVSNPNICRLLMLHSLLEHGCEPEFSCLKHFLVFACLWEHGRRLRCTHTMHSLTCMSVVVCVVRKLRPCNSYSRRRDRINSVLWRSYYKGGGVVGVGSIQSAMGIIHRDNRSTLLREVIRCNCTLRSTNNNAP